MKKGIYFFALSMLGIANLAFAQNSSDFYQDIMISEEFKMQDKVNNATDQARKLLEQKPTKLKIELPAGAIPTPRKLKPIEAKKTAPENLFPAPFGLLWGATVLDIQNLGISLKPVGEKDHVNSFTASNLPKSVRGFRQVDVTFGEDNELWRIIAYGDLLSDDETASRVLLEYRKYYSLLSQKYGNARQFYTPKTTINIDKTGKDPVAKAPDFNPAKDYPTIENAKNFLADLQSGETVLYATFENTDVGAALAVNVDGEGKSYIIIDYKSLKILRRREAQTLDAL